MPATAPRFLPPAYAEALRRLSIGVRRPVEGSRQGLHRSPRHGSSVEFADFRAYVPGDPPSRIDWAVYARSDRHMIRRFENETNVRAWVLVDASESMEFRGRGEYSKLEYGQWLAAGLLYVLASQGDACGIGWFRDGKVEFSPLAHGVAGLPPLLEALEGLQASGRTRLEACLTDAALRLPPRSVVFVISDFLEETEGVLRGVRSLSARGHDLTVFHVLDPDELRLRGAGVVELRELETGERLEVDVDEVRAAYDAAAAGFVEELRRGCGAALADYRLIETTTPVLGALARRAVTR